MNNGLLYERLKKNDIYKKEMTSKNLINLLYSTGFKDPILNAFSNTPREEFLPLDLKHHAYENRALKLKEGSTISQPSTIAFMLHLLEIRDNQKILEIGSGCGYTLELIREINPES
jgi:protein-L-isoaspartate(D-aspartate) O-methyltransferase